MKIKLTIEIDDFVNINWGKPDQGRFLEMENEILEVLKKGLQENRVIFTSEKLSSVTDSILEVNGILMTPEKNKLPNPFNK